MRTKVFILSFVLMGVIGLSSCKGTSAKKVMEIGGRVVRSLKNAPKSSNATTIGNVGRTAAMASKHIHVCATCDGYGVLYYVDQYENPIFDSNGDLLLTDCTYCGGTGVITD